MTLISTNVLLLQARPMMLKHLPSLAFNVFLLTVFARKFGHTLLVVFHKWDTSFTKLMLKNELPTNVLSTL